MLSDKAQINHWNTFKCLRISICILEVHLFKHTERTEASSLGFCCNSCTKALLFRNHLRPAKMYFCNNLGMLLSLGSQSGSTKEMATPALGFPSAFSKWSPHASSQPFSLTNPFLMSCEKPIFKSLNTYLRSVVANVEVNSPVIFKRIILVRGVVSPVEQIRRRATVSPQVSSQLSMLAYTTGGKLPQWELPCSSQNCSLAKLSPCWALQRATAPGLGASLSFH